MERLWGWVMQLVDASVPKRYFAKDGGWKGLEEYIMSKDVQSLQAGIFSVMKNVFDSIGTTRSVDDVRDVFMEVAGWYKSRDHVVEAWSSERVGAINTGLGFVDEATSKAADLGEKGFNDLVIAAQAKGLGYKLITRDRGQKALARNIGLEAKGLCGFNNAEDFGNEGWSLTPARLSASLTRMTSIMTITMA